MDVIPSANFEAFEDELKGIFYGIESGSDKVLKIIRKKFNSETAFKTLIKSKKYFDEVIASFIWGWPFATMNDFYETLIMMYRLQQEKIQTPFHQLSF